MYELVTYGSMVVSIICIVYMVYAAATGKLKKKK